MWVGVFAALGQGCEKLRYVGLGYMLPWGRVVRNSGMWVWGHAALGQGCKKLMCVHLGLLWSGVVRN